MSEQKKFEIPAFQGVKPQGFDHQSVSFVVPGATQSRAVGSSWARSAYRPSMGDIVGNHIQKTESIASIERQARETNNTAANDKNVEMIDIGEVLAGARETMELMDRETEELAKHQAEQDQRRVEAAKVQQEQESQAAQLREQQSMLTTILPPLIGVGAGLAWWKHSKDIGTSMLVGAGAWLLGTRVAPRIAHGAQQIHQTGVVPVLSAGAQVAGMAKRVA